MDLLNSLFPPQEILRVQLAQLQVQTGPRCSHLSPAGPAEGRPGSSEPPRTLESSRDAQSNVSLWTKASAENKVLSHFYFFLILGLEVKMQICLCSDRRGRDPGRQVVTPAVSVTVALHVRRLQLFLQLHVKVILRRSYQHEAA